MKTRYENSRWWLVYSMGAVFALLGTITCSNAAQTINNSQSIGLTIYSSANPASFNPQKFISQQRSGYTPQYVSQIPGFAVVREVRNFQAKKGVNVVNFSNVARFIDPTTVTFAQLNGGKADDLSVLKQTFLFDLVNPNKILDKYLGRNINVQVEQADKVKTISGILLSHNSGKMVIQRSSGQIALIPQGNAQISLGELPGGLITRPTLQWKIDALTAGAKDIRTSYQTAGITWRADYNLVLNQDDTKADLSAWVSILNLSGKSYDQAKLKLIAGDVHRVTPRNPRPRRYYMALSKTREDTGFKEKSFYTYHMYTLPRPATIKNNTVQQLMLFPTSKGVSVDKILVYDGGASSSAWRYASQPSTSQNFGNTSNHKVNVYIRVKNSKGNNLGMPLPAGKVRVYKLDNTDASGEGTMEFVGEDVIDHTPKDETLLIKTGQSFDIVGERKQVSFHYDRSANTITESYRIELRNHKDKSAKVIINEYLNRWSNWNIIQHNTEYKKVNSHTVHFPVTVPANEKRVVTYTVKYSW